MKNSFYVITLAILSFSFVSAQDVKMTSKLAENLFRKNHKWGVIVGYSSMYASNQSNSVRFELVNPRSFDLGLTYNMVQLGKFNLDLGLIYTSYNMFDLEAVKKEDSGRNYDYVGMVGSGSFHEINIPIQLEYLFYFTPDNDKFTGFVGFGPEISLHGHVYGSGRLTLHTPEGRVGYEEIEDYDHFMSVGVNFTAGTNIQVGRAFLLRPFITYHYQPDNLYTLTLNTVGLKSSPHTISRHRVTGNYLMFGLRIIPGKELF